MKQTWVVSMSVKGATTGQLTVPAQLWRAFEERGYNRARLSVTAEGLLVQPFRDESVEDRPQRRPVAELPEWS